MWIFRDFKPEDCSSALPVKILKGPRQVGKTSLLRRLESHHLVFLDDIATRLRAEQDPRFFLDQLPQRLVIDEAALAPNLFSELKRRVDEGRSSGLHQSLDVWLTGSNQTLMQRNVRESLAGRANYFDINTLSIHELGERWDLSTFLLRGGWPELYVSPQLDPVRYLNDLVSTFIEQDIVAAAGIERRAAFLKVLHLVAGRIGQLFNAADIATNVAVDSTTVQSWLSILELNGVVRQLPAYHTNLNKRFTKAPKYYFEDVALGVRLQGWNSIEPLLNSPLFGHLFENIVISEVSRFFLNTKKSPALHYVRSKEKVEVDLLVEIGDQRYIAIEAKVVAQDYTEAQKRLLDSLNLDIVERWVVALSPAPDFRGARVMTVREIWDRLNGHLVY